MSSRANALLAFQKNNWQLLQDNYNNLLQVQTKDLKYGDFIIKVQHNPERIKSTTTDLSNSLTDSDNSILHYNNLPAEQKALHYYKDYLILCNPYPIFQEHFTIPSVSPKPQLILNHFKDMLFLGRDIHRHHFVFYNGPECGASTPEHLHFQAGSKNIMPIDDEYDRVKKSHTEAILLNDKLQIYFSKNYLRNFISLESHSVEELQKGFNQLYLIMSKVYPNHQEPPMNILVNYDKSWRVIIFLRTKHRPSYFFLEGQSKIIVSPGAVDMGGLLILPREEDFNKITKENIVEVYRQVTSTREQIEFIKRRVLEAQYFTKT
ncbi:MAG: hypothetical protein A2V66_04445 [Ignavibacteria bacterium RBG_13_36_8]|nr:MAG: hypothetical protein A2V66_04445 [Ignavibacteria bacterium RBG_13_36_8]